MPLPTHFILVLLLLVFCTHAGAYHVSLQHEYINNTVQTTFRLPPNNEQTQDIPCVGGFIDLTPEQITTDQEITITNNHGRILRLRAGTLHGSEDTIATFSYAMSYRLAGPSIVVRLTCRASTDPTQPQVLREDFVFTTYKTTSQHTHCSNPDTKDALTMEYKCGTGFVPQYGCFFYNMNSGLRKVCYHPRTLPSGLRKLFPDIMQYAATIPPFTQDEKLKSMLDKANALAARGEPFGIQEREPIATLPRQSVETPRRNVAPRHTEPTPTHTPTPEYHPALGGIFLLLGLAGVIFLPKE